MPSEIATLRAALRANPEFHDKLRELAEAGRLKPCAVDKVDVIVAAPDHCGIDGAKQAKCACGGVVWLSPSTQAMIIARGDVPQPVIICVCCFQKGLKEMKESCEEKRTH